MVWGGVVGLVMAAAVAAPQDGAAGAPPSRPWHVCPAKPFKGPYYPPAATRREIKGAAVIQCRFTADTKAAACVFVSETPEGWGFGEAAEQLGCLIRMKPEPDTVIDPDGTYVRQAPINFKLPKF